VKWRTQRRLRQQIGLLEANIAARRALERLQRQAPHPPLWHPREGVAAPSTYAKEADHRR
jgi:hypothetical protein